LRCYVDPGRALWVSTPKLVAHLGAAGRAKSREFDTYLREFDEALLDGKPQVIAMEREVDLVFDRMEREKPAGEVLFEFRPYDEVAADIVAFFADRLEVWLRDRGQRHDLVAAVFALGDDDLVRVVARVSALDAFLKTEDGANLLAGYKRAVNILKAEEKKGVLPAGAPVRMATSSPEELALIAAVDELGAKLDTALDAEDFAGGMRELAKLRGPVDAFFDKVLVNSDVPEERDNRLRLLAKVKDAMGTSGRLLTGYGLARGTITRWPTRW
jgi:glycyl-tRNA synthetase beta chain